MEDPEHQQRLKFLFNYFVSSDPENCVNFFVRFITEHADFKPLFTHLRGVESADELRQNEWLRNTHVPHLMDSIRFIIENVHDEAAVRAEAIRIFHMPAHIGNEIYEMEYGLMFKALLQSIEESCMKEGGSPEATFTDDDRALWMEFASWIYLVFSERCSANRDAVAAANEEDPAACLPKAAKGSCRKADSTDVAASDSKRSSEESGPK